MPDRMRGPVVVGIVIALTGCGRDSVPVTGPAATAAPAPAPGGPAALSSFAVSGVITERRAGPLAGVKVVARPNFPPGHGNVVTTTNAAGQYRIEGLTEPTILDFEKEGYDGVGNAGAFDRETTLNIVLDRTLQIAAGGSLTATIWGDDDFWAEELGMTCHTPQVCRLVNLVTSGPGTVTAQLRPTSAGYRLGFIIFQWLSNSSFTAVEVPGSGGVVAVSADLPFGGSYPLAVQIFGASKSDHQDFELTTRFVPR